MFNLLKSLGSKITLSKDRKTARIQNKKRLKTLASYSLVKTMRASILVLGPLISKFHKSTTSYPGVQYWITTSQLSLSALKKLGMKYQIKKSLYSCKI